MVLSPDFADIHPAPTWARRRHVLLQHGSGTRSMLLNYSEEAHNMQFACLDTAVI